MNECVGVLGCDSLSLAVGLAGVVWQQRCTALQQPAWGIHDIAKWVAGGRWLGGEWVVGCRLWIMGWVGDAS
jgi:hypothetical protein